MIVEGRRVRLVVILQVLLVLLVEFLGGLDLVFELVAVLWRIRFDDTLALDVAEEAIRVELFCDGVDLLACQLVCENGSQVDAAVLFFKLTDELERLRDRLLEDQIQLLHLILLLLEHLDFPREETLDFLEHLERRHVIHHFGYAHILQRIIIILLFIQFSVTVDTDTPRILIISFSVNSTLLVCTQLLGHRDAVPIVISDRLNINTQFIIPLLQLFRLEATLTPLICRVLIA